MDSDPLSGAGRAALHKKTFESSRNDPKSKSCSNGINLVLCVVCIVSVSCIVYDSFRESELRSRLVLLEDRVARLEGKPSEDIDVVVERIRREAFDHLKRRVARDVGGLRRPEGDAGRAAREAPECVCPAGKRSTRNLVLLH